MCQFLTGLRDDSVFPNNVPERIAALGEWWSARVADRSTWLGTLAVSMKSRSFYYTLLYTLAVGIVRDRADPPPPHALRHGADDHAVLRAGAAAVPAARADPALAGLQRRLRRRWRGATSGTRCSSATSPRRQYLAHEWPEWGHPRAYWRAYGLILAWPLMVYNVFTHEPIAGWLVISFVQTFVIIPLLVWRFGKGAYCGWICSCGGLAETMGDTLRNKMPHGPFWNRLNMVGQANSRRRVRLLVIRILGWIWPESWMSTSFDLLLEGKRSDGMTVNPLSWKWTVDVIVAGVLGVGLYVKYSGRVWCRFACPLAALMHIYARFSRSASSPRRRSASRATSARRSATRASTS